MKQKTWLKQETGAIYALIAVLVLCFASLAQAENKPVTVTPEEAKFSISLQKREQAVSQLEQEQKLEREQLDILKKDVDAKLAKITTLQQDVSEKLTELKQIQDVEFKNLIKIYSTMSGSKVAPLLNEMDDRNVARILRAMKNDLVAKIIPKLEPRKAVRVSRILGRIDETP